MNERMSLGAAKLFMKDCRVGDILAPAIPSLDWCLLPGEAWAVLGSSGGGKEAFADALAGFLPVRPNHGGEYYPGLGGNTAMVSFEAASALLKEERYHDDSDFVEGGVAEGTSVRAFITAALPEGEVPRYPGGRGLETHPVVKACAVSGYIDRGLKRLSTGECRRVLLCRAVVQKPDLIIAVDPYEGLDSETRSNLHRMLEDLAAACVQGEAGAPALVLVDRLGQVPTAVNRVIEFDGGVARFSGTREAYEDMYARTRASPSREAEGDSTVSNPSFPAGCQELSCLDELVGLGEPVSHRVSQSGLGITDRFTHTLGTIEAAEPPRSETAVKSQDTLVELRDVTVAWAGKVVLDRVSWTVRRGEHWLVRGPNGSGKTTLLELITGDNPQSYCNEVRVFGQRRGGGQTIWELKSRIGIVSYRLHLEYRYLESMALEDVILSGLYDSIGLYTTVSDGERKLARTWLNLAGFEGRGSRRFGQISFGEQRALLVARGAIKLPELLILDEPCHGLDDSQRGFVLSLLASIAGRGQSTMIHVTHDPQEVQSFETRVLELRPGQSPMWAVSER